MTEYLAEYALFLAKCITFVLAFLFFFAGIAYLSSRRKSGGQPEGEIQLLSMNDHLEDMRMAIEEEVLDEDLLKAIIKDEKRREKEEKKQRKKQLKAHTSKEPEKRGDGEEEAEQTERKKRVYVLSFDGDIEASEVEPLRQEISAILTMAEPQDEVVLKLESPGGLVHEYGLASSQLERIKRQQIPLTICVDRVAASGGYMMACLADRLMAAPFAVLGSVGVVAQLPNFNRLLKKHDVDYDIYTAGEFKRTVTMFGENTEKGREKFIEELEDTHLMFKQFVSEARPQLDVDKISTGEAWFGKKALELKLVDELMTSDEYLTQACETADVFSVRYELRKTLQDRISELTSSVVERSFLRMMSKLYRSNLLSK